MTSVGGSGAAWPNLKAAFVSPRRPHRRKRTHLIARASQSLFKERAPMTDPFDPSGPSHLSASDRAVEPAVRPWLDIAGSRPCAEPARSEEQTSEFQSLMRNSYAVFCLKKTHNQLLPL